MFNRHTHDFGPWATELREHTYEADTYKFIDMVKFNIRICLDPECRFTECRKADQ